MIKDYEMLVETIRKQLLVSSVALVSCRFIFVGRLRDNGFIVSEQDNGVFKVTKL